MKAIRNRTLSALKAMAVGALIYGGAAAMILAVTLALETMGDWIWSVK